MENKYQKPVLQAVYFEDVIQTSGDMPENNNNDMNYVPVDDIP